MKNFNPTPEMIEAAGTVFLAMAHTETIRPTIEAIQLRILLENKYQVEKEWRTHEQFTIITERRNDYLMSREDMQDYCNKLNAEYLNAGFVVENSYCPLLIAESMEREAKRILIDSLAPVIGITGEQACRNLENYRKIVELSLKLMAPFCNSKEILHSVNL